MMGCEKEEMDGYMMGCKKGEMDIQRSQKVWKLKIVLLIYKICRIFYIVRYRHAEFRTSVCMGC